jgi:hypothetical protein
MRRPARTQILRGLGLFAGLAVLPLAAAVSAQGPGQTFPVRPTVDVQEDFKGFLPFSVNRPAPAQAHPELAIGRVLSFDRNGNGRVEKAELGERMLPLVTRGDANADGALDETEIRKLASKPLARSTPQIAGFSNTYGFGEDVGLSSRSHIEGAIDDLRLSKLHRDDAMKVVTRFMDARDRAVVEDLLKELAEVVPDQQLAGIRATLEQHPNIVTNFAVGFSSAVNKQNAKTVVMRGADGQTTRVVTMLAGQPQETAAAMSVLSRHKERQRLNEAERTALLGELQDVLSDEDRDDFRAAIERRPVVAANTAKTFNFTVGKSF